MSRNSSVAVLADCTDLYNSHVSLTGINGGPSSVLSIENETLLSNNTDVSPSQVISSVSFLERVQSTNLAALFPRGSLNHIKKKKKKSIESSLSTSSQSENISSSQSNVGEPDENLSFEADSESKVEPAKPFNKRLYLKKKSVKLSFDSGSLNNSITEKSLRRSNRVVNVSLDPLYSKTRNVSEVDENASDLEGSERIKEGEESSKIFNTRSLRKKKSVNISFDSGSLNSSVTELSQDSSQISNISLPSKRRNASRKHKLNSVISIDNLESAECSLETSITKKTKINEKTNKRSSKITKGKSSDENIPKDNKTYDSLKPIELANTTESAKEGKEEESAKLFNKNLYLKKKSIHISFDSSSLNDAIEDDKFDSSSRVDDVSLNPLSSKDTSATELAKEVDNEEKSAKVFNKNLYLKRKSIHMSFDSSSFNNDTGDESLVRNNQVDDISLDVQPLKNMNASLGEDVSVSAEESQNRDNKEESADVNKRNSKKSSQFSLDSTSLNDPVAEKSLNGNNQDILLNPTSPKITNATEMAEDVSVSVKERKIAEERQSVKSFNEDLYLKKSINNSFDTNSLTDAVAEKSFDRSSKIEDVSSNLPSKITDAIASALAGNVSISLEETQKTDDKEVSGVVIDENLNKSIKFSCDSTSLNDSVAEKILDKNDEVDDSLLNPPSSKTTNATASIEDVSVSVDESQKIDSPEGPATVFNKNLYSKKKSIHMSFDSSSLNDTNIEISHDSNSRDDNVSLHPLFPKIDKDKELAESVNVSFEASQKIDNEVKPENVFKKDKYMKKKSICISFDSSSIDDSMMELRVEKNDQVDNVLLDSLSQKSMDATPLAETVSHSFEESQKIENKEESVKLFNKNLYLKKKSIKISFDSTSLNDPLAEESPNKNRDVGNVLLNTQVENVPSDSLSQKTMNASELTKTVSNSFEVPQKMSKEEESANVFNKNLYLKKKSINISFDSSSFDDPIEENKFESNSQNDVSSDPLSPKIANATELAEDVSTSVERSTKIEKEEEESAKLFNKNLYLKNKSINISFDTTSLNDPDVDKSFEINSKIENLSSNLPSKITNATAMAEDVSFSIEDSQKTHNIEESAEVESDKVFKKNSYLKKKSIKFSFDSTSLNDQVTEMSFDRNNQVDDISLNPPSKITKAFSTGKDVSVSVEESQKTDNKEESMEVINKSLKKSINIPIDSTSLNDPVAEKSLERNSEIENFSLNLSPETTHDTASAVSSEESQKTDKEESAEVINKSLKKSINIPIDSTSLNDLVAEKSLEKNSEIENFSLNLSPETTHDTASADVPVSVEESQKTDKEESAEVINKSLKNALNIPIDSSSLNDQVAKKSLERNIEIANVPSNPPSEIMYTIASAKDVSLSVEESQKTDNNEEFAVVINKSLKKSINIPIDSTSLNDQVAKKSLERNIEIENVQSNPTSEITYAIASAKDISISVEESQKTDNKEESADVINKSLKKSINIQIDSTSLNGPDAEKSLERNSEIEKLSLNLSPEITHDTTSAENISVSVEESTNTNNLNLKKSINIPIDSASSKDSVVEKSIERKSKIENVSSIPPSEILRATASAEDISVYVEDSPKTDNKEAPAEVFDKNLKKSIDISIDSPFLDDQVAEKSIENNSEIEDVPVSVEESNKKGNKDESAEVINKSLKKIINVPINSTSLNNPFVEKSLERNNEIEDVSLNPPSKITKDVATAEDVLVSVEESQNTVNKEESSEVINKNSYPKKRSKKFSSSLNEPVSKKSLDKNNHIDDISLNPPSEIKKDVAVLVSAEESQNTVNEEESSEVINKNSHPKKRSKKFSSSLNEPVSKKSIDKNNHIDNISLNPPSEIKKDVAVLVSAEESQNTVNEEESSEVINKNSHPKKKSIKFSSSLNEPVSKKSIDKNNHIDNISLNPPSEIKKDVAVLVSAEVSQNTVNKEESSEVINKNSHPKNKSIKFSSSLNEPVSKMSLDKNNQVCDILLNPPSSEITNATVSVSIEGSQKIVNNKAVNKNDMHANIGTNDSLEVGSKRAVEEDSAARDSKRKKSKSISNSINTSSSQVIKASKKRSPQQSSFSSYKPKRRSITNTNSIKNTSTKITSEQLAVSEEVNSGSKHVFACPDIPARNLRERSVSNMSLNVSKTSKKDARNQSGNLDNSAKKSKTSPSGNGTEDFIQDISIIPNPKPFTRSRVMYHSTPISRAFSKRNRSRIRGRSNMEMENENIQQDDKMIQVSKSIFGSSTEVTNATVSKKKSIECTNNSSPSIEKSDHRTKRKSDSNQTGIKKLPKIDSFAESRSYHSNFISTFEDESSYCTTRKSMKRVAFKSISSLENSSSGYGNGYDDYTSRNRKSVGFRDVISLIEDTAGNSSDGDIRDVNNSHCINSIRISDTPDVVNVSKGSIDRSHLSLNYSAEVPEIILTENEIESNEVSRECSLFNKLIEMAGKKKSGRNMATRQNKQSRGRKRLGGSNLVIAHATSDARHHEKWVSPNLIKYLNNKLMTDDLDHVIKTERVVSILCSAVSAVRNLQDADDIDFALLPLKNILSKLRVCSNMIEYCTFISRFTPFEFQRKALPLEGYFGSIKRGIRKKLTDPILTETEKMNVFL